MNEPHDIIQTVRLTEKATLLAEKENKYVFRVHPVTAKYAGISPFGGIVPPASLMD